MAPLLITHNAAAFRTPFYNCLVRDHGFRVVVLTSKHGDIDNLDPSIETVTTRSLFGFRFPTEKIDLNKDFPIVLIFDLAVLPWAIVNLRLRSIFLWGIGYGNRYVSNFFRRLVLMRAKGLLSYMPSGQALTTKTKAGGNFFLINSVFVPNSGRVWKPTKKLAFVGTIDHRKRLDVLVDAVLLLRELGEHWTVTIVGDGPALDQIKSHVRNHQLEESFEFHGRLTTSEEKKAAIEGAFLTVLPGQSGLSVLESFAYGIPVLTWQNAVSGGENDNIVDGVTGYVARQLCPVQFALTISSLFSNPTEVEKVSHKCFEYFSKVASGERMTKRFVAAIGQGHRDNSLSPSLDTLSSQNERD
tara:strand:- start:478 stop:1548 length:1071 start_codon:yes stop_codon:yes gene_type:complete